GVRRDRLLPAARRPPRAALRAFVRDARPPAAIVRAGDGVRGPRRRRADAVRRARRAPLVHAGRGAAALAVRGPAARRPPRKRPLTRTRTHRRQLSAPSRWPLACGG